MNKPDKAGEPSMDEILASIRQIIAEEPEASLPAVGAAPDATTLSPADVSRAVPPPALLDRLNGVLKSNPPAGSSFGSKRPLPFDQDLADMLDEPGADEAAFSAAPKPDKRVAPELVSPLKGADGGKGPEVSTAPGALSVPPPFVPSSAPLSPPPPFGGAGPGAAALQPQTYSFPPLTNRGGGFFPPAERPTSPGGSPVTRSTSTAALPSAADDAALTRVADLGALVPGEIAGTAGLAVGRAADAPFRATDDGAASAAAPLGLSDVLPSLDARPVTQPDVSASLLPEPETAARGRPVLDGAPADAVGGDVLANSAPIAAGQASDERDAAAQALDALAQGLAASAAVSAVKPSPPEAPVAQAAPAASAAAVATPPVPALSVSAAPVRTLEDVVADMLRPMLQQWVQENMPRIMEKALRVEMAKSLGAGPKPPGF